MCGIFGFISKVEKNSHDIVKTMMAQQHRGHDAWGLCFKITDKFEAYKQTGPIDLHSVRHFFTKIAVGHNRYQTSGRGSLNEIQPFASKNMVLAHNGQITNIEKMEFGSDTSLVFNYMLKNSFSSQVFKEFEGAYSFIGYDEKSFFALRDKNGFRPLFMGINKNEFVAFASEEQALLRFGAQIIEEVHPGTIVRVDENLNITKIQSPEAQHCACFFESVYFSSVQSSLSGQKIIQTREKLGQALALQIQQSKIPIDLVVPIPDTSIPSAILIAETLQKPYREYILKNPRSLRTFITRDNRAKSIEDKYHFMFDNLKDKNLLLVDDSIVRGSTLRNINRILRAAGVKSIHVASTCPPIKHPCAFGIDFPSKTELIANETNLEEKLMADSIHYLQTKTLKEIYGNKYCFACIDGNYPVKVSEKFFKARIEEHE